MNQPSPEEAAHLLNNRPTNKHIIFFLASEIPQIGLLFARTPPSNSISGGSCHWIRFYHPPSSNPAPIATRYASTTHLHRTSSDTLSPPSSSVSSGSHYRIRLHHPPPPLPHQGPPPFAAGGTSRLATLP